MKKFTVIALISAMLISAVSMSACNKNNNEPNQPNNNTESSVQSVEEISLEPSKAEITSSQLAQLSTKISSYKSVPKFTCKSDTIDAKDISKDAVISFIADNQNDSYTELVTKQFSSAADSAGFKKVVKAKTDGTPALFNDALNAAITDKNDMVIMFGNINKDSISSEIEKTQANGIKIISGGNAGLKENDHFVDNTVPINFQLIGEIMSDWSIVKQNGKVNALAINLSDSGASNSIYKGFSDEFKKYVSSGYCTTLNVTNAEVGNGLATKIKDALQEDPNLNSLIVFDDSMIDDAVSAIEQSGKSIKIIATGGSKEAFDATQNSKVEMLVAQSYEWTAYAMVDYALRVMSKSTLPEEQDVPIRVVTADSINDELKKNNDDNIDGFYEICFGSAFVEGYSNLWKL